MRLPTENELRLSQTIAAPSYEPTGRSRIAARANDRERPRGPRAPRRFDGAAARRGVTVMRLRPLGEYHERSTRRIADRLVAVRRERAKQASAGRRSGDVVAATARDTG